MDLRQCIFRYMLCLCFLMLRMVNMLANEVFFSSCLINTNGKQLKTFNICLVIHGTVSEANPLADVSSHSFESPLHFDS